MQTDAQALTCPSTIASCTTECTTSANFVNHKAVFNHELNRRFRKNPEFRVFSTAPTRS